MANFDTFYISVLLLPLLIGVLLYFLFKRRKKTASKSPFFILWNSLLTLFLITLVFLIGESYYRFFLDTTDAFGMNKITQRWMARHYSLNNFKARDNVPYQLQVPAGKKRLTFVGDSFTAGHGIEDVDDRFPNLIRASAPQLDVHVMAANGLETVDHAALLQKLVGDGYAFEEVVLVYVPNDIAPLAPETEAFYDRVRSYEEESGFWIDNSYWINTLYYRRKAASEPAIRDLYNYLPGSYFSEAWEKQKQLLSEIKAIIESRGGRLHVVIFPFLHDLSDTYAFRAAHQQLQVFLRSLNTPYIDLLPVFEKEKEADLCVNRFDPHPNEHANQLAAEAILGFLQQVQIIN